MTDHVSIQPLQQSTHSPANHGNGYPPAPTYYAQPSPVKGGHG